MIIRSVHKDHYTLIRNQSIRDSRLSLRATGILALFLSLPDDAVLTRENIARLKPKDSMWAVRAALKELVDAGYLERHRVRLPDGRMVTESVLHEEPKVAYQPSVDRPSVGQPALRSNKEGPAHASPPPPPEYVCAACGVKADYMRRDETWWCKEHYHGAGLRVVGDGQA